MADNNYYSIADQTGIEVKDKTFDPRRDGIDPSTIADVFKLSHATNILVDNIVVDAGGLQTENAIDMNRVCSQIIIRNSWLVSGMENAITIKGGCHDVLIENVKIAPGKGHCDIEIGNYSQQSKSKTINITLKNVSRTDGKAIKLRIGNGNYPEVINSVVDYLWFQSIILKIYIWYKNKFVFPNP